MNIKINIPDWLKIPLYILIPTVLIVSGILISLPPEYLIKLHLEEWCEAHGFGLGIAFVTSIALIGVYIFYYLIGVVKYLGYLATYKWLTLYRISKLSYAEQGILIHLFNSPGYTAQLDFNQPMVKGLLSRQLIYTGSTQLVTTNPYTNQVPILCALQPAVYQTLEYLDNKIKNKKEKIEHRIANTKNLSKERNYKRNTMNCGKNVVS